MTSRTKNLAVAGGAAALLGIIGVNVLVSPPAAPSTTSPAAIVPSPRGAGIQGAEPQAVASAPAGGGAAYPLPSPAAARVVGSGTTDSARRSYAIGLADLQGLPPDAAPGTAFELWVTWEPPVTGEPRLQRLIADVILERVIPGTVPEAPVTVLLSVPAARAGDLIYADTFGRLNVVLPG
ncbi:MAG: hypothetical protein M3323_13410 [Actinomycetota bacterium]|nr:hypothetical protein [Actinomycetota bacterium]